MKKETFGKGRKIGIIAIAAVLVLSLLLCSCGNKNHVEDGNQTSASATVDANAVVIKNGAEEPAVEPVQGLKTNSAGFGINARNLSILKLLDNGEGKNVLFSPAGLDHVLSMAELGAANETFRQIRVFTGSDYQSLDSAAVKTYDLLIYNNKMKLIRDSYIQSIREAEWMNGDAMGVDPDNAGKDVETVNRKVGEVTDGMIENALDPDDAADPLMQAILINTIHFKSGWAKGELKEKTDVFQNSDGKNVSATFLSLVSEDEPQFFENDSVAGFLLDYKEDGGRYCFAAFLPKEDCRVLDYDALKFTGMRFDEDVNLGISFPEFSFRSENEMTAVLKKMGVRDLFDKSVCDLSKGFETEKLPVCADKLIQKTAITVNKQGTEAAAYTEVRMTAAAMNPGRVVRLNFNRPFVYMIYDRVLEKPLFVGQVSSIPGNKTKQPAGESVNIEEREEEADEAEETEASETGNRTVVYSGNAYDGGVSLYYAGDPVISNLRLSFDQTTVSPFQSDTQEGIYHIVVEKDYYKPSFLCTSVIPTDDGTDDGIVRVKLFGYVFNRDNGEKISSLGTRYSDEWKLSEPGDHYKAFLKGLAENDFSYNGSLTGSLPEEPGDSGYQVIFNEGNTGAAGDVIKDNGYIFGNSAEEMLEDKDTDGLSPEVLQIARNEVYARRGYIFKNPELRSWFENKAWYTGTVPAENFDESVFNEFENANISFLKKAELEHDIEAFLGSNTSMLTSSYEDVLDLDLDPVIWSSHSGIDPAEVYAAMAEAGIENEFDESWIMAEALNDRLLKATGHGLTEMHDYRQPEIPEKNLYLFYGYSDVVYPEVMYYYGYCRILEDDGNRIKVRFRYTPFGPKYSRDENGELEYRSECITVVERDGNGGYRIVSNQRTK